jgi:hypothetical protein
MEVRKAIIIEARRIGPLLLNSGWCSRALTGRSAEFRPTAAAAAAAGQFQCAPNLCFEFGMQK